MICCYLSHRSQLDVSTDQFVHKTQVGDDFLSLFALPANKIAQFLSDTPKTAFFVNGKDDRNTRAREREGGRIH